MSQLTVTNLLARRLEARAFCLRRWRHVTGIRHQPSRQPSSLTLGQGPPDNLCPGHADPAGGTVHDSSVTEGREKPSDIRRTHWVPYSLQVSAHPRGRVPQAGFQTGRPGTGPEAPEIPPAEILHGNCGCCPSSRCPYEGMRAWVLRTWMSSTWSATSGQTG